MKFVIALDGSDASDRALDHAVALAEGTDWTLTLVHSVHPDVFDVGGVDPAGDRSEAEGRLILEGVDDAERRGEAILADAEERVADAEVDVDADAGGHVDAGAHVDVTVETELLYGDPVETVSSFATTEGYDGIFVGHRDRSERAEHVLGSVAKGLVERSSVPVTVVR